MATIDITHAHSLSKEVARERAEELAKSLKERLGIDWTWEGDALRFSAPSGPAKGTKGEVRGAESSVRVRVGRATRLRMLKGKVEQKVQEKLSQLL